MPVFVPTLAFGDEAPESTEPPVQYDGSDGEFVADGIIVVLDDQLTVSEDGEDAGMRLQSTDEAAAVEEAMVMLEDMSTVPLEELAVASESSGTTVKVEVPEGTDIEQAAVELAEQPGVAYAQPDFVYHLLEGDVESNEVPGKTVLQQDTEDSEQPLPDEGARPEGQTPDAEEAPTGDPEQEAAGSEANIQEPEVLLSEEAPAGEEDENNLLAISTNDTAAGYQYYLGSWAASKGAGIKDAWDIAGITSSDRNMVTVAVLDTGANIYHEDLTNNINKTYMWDAYNKRTLTGDTTGHGTHVAGIIAAQANNGKGIAGVSYNAKVLPIKVFNDSTSDSTATCSTSTLISAYDYLFGLVDSGKVKDLRVINMSLGGYGGPTTVDLALQAKIKTARDTYNIVTVCAGGNGNSSNVAYTKAMYPSDFEECVSVTALDSTGSNTAWSDYNMSKDISAPGASIYSTYNTSTNSYKFMSGTSMATPVVSGVFALLWSVNPNLDVTDALTSIYTTTNRVNTAVNNRTGQTGSRGAIDASKAVTYVKQNYASTGAKTPMSACTVASIAAQTYTGTARTPSVTVTNGTSTLRSGTDYTTAYSNNINAGTAVVTITGKGEYTGSITKTFSISKAPLTVTVTGASASKSYTGSLQSVDGFTSSVSASQASVTLKPGYRAHAEGTSPGTYKMGLTAAYFNVSSTNYTVTLRVVDGTLTIGSANNLVVAASSVSTAYSGRAVSLTAIATVGGKSVSGATIRYYNESTRAYDLTSAPSFKDYTGGAQTVRFMATHPNFTNTAYGQATITITQAKLTITTSSATKTYTGTPLTASGSMTGLVNGETADFSVTGSQTQIGSSKNNYSLRWNGTAKSSNYTISSSIGTLTVNPASSYKLSYTAHVQNIGWQPWVTEGKTIGTTGRSLRMEALKISLTNLPYSGGIQYRSHVQNIGWMSWVGNGGLTGTSGRSLQVEAIQIMLTGEMANKYDIYYRSHCTNIGWTGWAKNGGSTGTAGYTYSMQALEIKIVPKGAAAPGSTAKPFDDKNDMGRIKYQAHVQNIGWQPYVGEGKMAGTTGRGLRFEALRLSLVNPQYSGSIQYKAHVQNIGWMGWVGNGGLTGTSGRSLRVEALQIKLTGEMANKYDIYYRAHCTNFGWLGWAKNGASCGTAGYSYSMQALEVRLVEKGQPAPGSTANPFRQR